MSRRLPTLFALAGASLAALVAAPAAHATFPGANGQIAYYSTPYAHPDRGTIRTMDQSGSGDALLLDDKAYDEYAPQFSPDGKSLAWISLAGGKYDGVYAGPFGGSNKALKLVAKSPDADRPSWNPDGKTLVFTQYGVGIRSVPADGSSKPTTLVKSAKTVELGNPIYGAGGTAIIYTRYVLNRKGDTKRSELWTAGADGSAPRKLVGDAGTFAHVDNADLSPDGQRLVFVAAGGPTAADALYLSAADGSAPTQLLQASKKLWLESPAWSPDGSRIVFDRTVRRKNGASAIITVVAATGAQKILATSKKAWLAMPTWQPIR